MTTSWHQHVLPNPIMEEHHWMCRVSTATWRHNLTRPLKVLELEPVSETGDAPMYFFLLRHHCARSGFHPASPSLDGPRVLQNSFLKKQPSVSFQGFAWWSANDIWRFFKFGPSESASSAAGCERSCFCSMCLMEQDISPPVQTSPVDLVDVKKVPGTAERPGLHMVKPMP